MSYMLASFAKSSVSDILLLGAFLLSSSLEVTVGPQSHLEGCRVSREYPKDQNPLRNICYNMAACGMQVLPGTGFRSALLSSQPAFAPMKRPLALWRDHTSQREISLNTSSSLDTGNQLSSTFPISSRHWLQKLSIYIAAK